MFASSWKFVAKERRERRLGFFEVSEYVEGFTTKSQYQWQ